MDRFDVVRAFNTELKQSGYFHSNYHSSSTNALAIFAHKRDFSVRIDFQQFYEKGADHNDANLSLTLRPFHHPHDAAKRCVEFMDMWVIWVQKYPEAINTQVLI